MRGQPNDIMSAGTADLEVTDCVEQKRDLPGENHTGAFSLGMHVLQLFGMQGLPDRHMSTMFCDGPVSESEAMLRYSRSRLVPSIVVWCPAPPVPPDHFDSRMSTHRFDSENAASVCSGVCKAHQHGCSFALLSPQVRDTTIAAVQSQSCPPKSSTPSPQP